MEQVHQTPEKQDNEKELENASPSFGGGAGFASASRPGDENLAGIQEAANQSDSVQFQKAIGIASKMRAEFKKLEEIQRIANTFNQQKEESTPDDINRFESFNAKMKSLDGKDSDLNAAQPKDANGQENDQMAAEPQQEQNNGEGHHENHAGENESPVQKKGVIQAKIEYDNGLFYVDGKRPAWRKYWKGMKMKTNRSRNHIIPYSYIENEIAVRLNNYLSTGKSSQFTLLQNFLRPFFSPTRKTEYRRYKKLIKELEEYIDLQFWGFADAAANELLSMANSSRRNVRIGKSNLNSSIQENLDCDFKSGSHSFSGKARMNSGKIKKVKKMKVLRLSSLSNELVWNTLKYSQGSPTFVIDPKTNKQMSSVTAPTKKLTGGPMPILIEDPNNVDEPFIFN